ncbi:SurA N-terminal domain-containing protein [Actinokineospora xionganensis]|uniref:SurA N-terminal domain-containing protein n=1 Tax=Actinokineospora xionganensis TaxID=2684470 RepID=A0ABR7LC84_9PSEU|nr:SurA N-terminal domain-containing protein [Actinokineospora xionganensis]MBC6450290.1 SurA N-terminal domain-containing protein [Actinokineospora xionganensis]
MTTVIRRRRPLVVLLAVFGLLLSACSTGPGQANAAAIVNGKTIGVDRVQELVDKARQAEPAVQQLADQRKLDLLSRAVLRQLVLHELIAAHTAKETLAINEATVTELAGQLTSSLQPLPTDGSASPEQIVDQAVNRAFEPTEIARDYLALAEIGRKQAPGLSVTFDFTLVAPGGPDDKPGSLREKAIAKANQLAVGLDEAGKIIDADMAGGLQAARGETITPSLAPDIAGSVLFGAPLNSVIAFQPNPQNAGWVVAVIRKRETNATPGPDDKPADARLATTLGPRMLQDTSQRVGVEISPRYGVWDLAGMEIAPSEGETKGVVIPIKNAGQ